MGPLSVIKDSSHSVVFMGTFFWGSMPSWEGSDLAMHCVLTVTIIHSERKLYINPLSSSDRKYMLTSLAEPGSGLN